MMVETWREHGAAKQTSARDAGKDGKGYGKCGSAESGGIFSESVTSFLREWAREATWRHSTEVERIKGKERASKAKARKAVGMVEMVMAIIIITTTTIDLLVKAWERVSILSMTTIGKHGEMILITTTTTQGSGTIVGPMEEEWEI